MLTDGVSPTVGLLPELKLVPSNLPLLHQLGPGDVGNPQHLHREQTEEATAMAPP